MTRARALQGCVGTVSAYAAGAGRSVPGFNVDPNVLVVVPDLEISAASGACARKRRSASSASASVSNSPKLVARELVEQDVPAASHVRHIEPRLEAKLVERRRTPFDDPEQQVIESRAVEHKEQRSCFSGHRSSAARGNVLRQMAPFDLSACSRHPPLALGDVGEPRQKLAWRNGTRPEIGLEQVGVAGHDHVSAAGLGERYEVVVVGVAGYHTLGGRIVDDPRIAHDLGPEHGHESCVHPPGDARLGEDAVELGDERG